MFHQYVLKFSEFDQRPNLNINTGVNATSTVATSTVSTTASKRQ